MNAKTYQPKGGMCAVCEHRSDDCSALPFDRMQPIAQDANVIIVKCWGFEKRKETPGTLVKGSKARRGPRGM